MDEHDQLPMFSGDAFSQQQREFKELLELSREQARALHELTRITRELIQNARDARNGLVAHKPEDQAEPTPLRRTRHVPQIRELREWHSCRAYFQRFEREVRRDLQLGPDDEVSKEMLHAAGAPSAKTILRVMVETHGLRPEQWPPSTWPEELPATF